MHRNTRLVALSYNPGECFGQSDGSIVNIYLDRGAVYMRASRYSAGGDETDFSPRVPIPANQWVTLEMRLRVARDNTGWGELIVNGKSQGRRNGVTMKTPWGRYNQTQWGGGWSEAGTPSTSVYLDDATVSAL